MSNRYAEKVRRYLVSECDILDIEIFNGNHFKNANQPVIILKCQKISKNTRSRYELYIKDTLMFVKNIDGIPIGNHTIKSLGCKVKTGGIVWNKYSDMLSDTRDDDMYKIYYSCDIIGNETKNKSKKPYLMCNNDTRKYLVSGGAHILVQRIFSDKIVYKLVENEEFYCENHINVITGNVDVLRKICESFDKPDTKVFIKNVFNNSHISQYELENIIQIY
jgi:hypothetical protein